MTFATYRLFSEFSYVHVASSLTQCSRLNLLIVTQGSHLMNTEAQRCATYTFHETRRRSEERVCNPWLGTKRKGSGVSVYSVIQIQRKNLDPGDLNVLRIGFGFLSERNCSAYKKDCGKKCPTCPFYQDLCQNLMGSPWPQTILPPSCMNSFCVILLTDKPWKHGLHGKGNLVLCVLW